MAAELAQAGIAYEFFGVELGGTPDDPTLWERDGRPDFARIAASEPFRAARDRLLALVRRASRILVLDRVSRAVHLARQTGL